VSFTFSRLGGVNIVRKKSGSFNQIDYIKEFNKKTYKRYIVQIRNERVDLINWIDQHPSKNAYIIGLIEKDMNQNK
jgi:hypothetical protein